MSRPTKAEKLTKDILEITNDSPFGWLDLNSVEGRRILELIKHHDQTKSISANNTDSGK